MFQKLYQLTSSPRNLFYLFLGLGILFTAIFAYPISLVFQGKWELGQKIPLFTIPDYGPIDLRFYSIFMLLGLIAGYLLALKLAKIRGLADTVVDRLFVGIAFFGLVGARIFYILFNLDDFFIEGGDWSLIFQTYRGGLAIFGALLFGSLYMFWYCWRYKFNFWLFGDFVAPSVLLGQIIGRFGNFFNYESYGYPTKVWWKMYVPDSANVDFLSDKYFHPTFLYEIIPNFILLLAILYFYDNLTKKHAGLVLSVYLVGYGLIRFFVEIFRIDPLLLNIGNIPVFGDVPIRISMAAAYLIFILGLCIWWVRRRVYVRYQTVTEIKLK